MVYRIYVEKKPGFDVEAQGLKNELVSLLGIQSLSGLRLLNRYDVEGLDEAAFRRAVGTVFSEPQVDDTAAALPAGDCIAFGVEPLPGQFDQRADSAAQCIQLMTQEERPTVRTARIYLLFGPLTAADVDAVKRYVLNPVECREASLDLPERLAAETAVPADVETVTGFTALDRAGLDTLLARLGLAMDLEDLSFLQAYFRDTERRDPTLTEIRVVDTYWSDHCRHTTFSTHLDHVEINDPAVQAAYNRYLAAREEVYGTEKAAQRPQTLMDIATIGAKVLKRRGLLPEIDESEEINACSIHVAAQVNDKPQDWLLMFKNETHNHPTEIEPFGGAATCIGGCIRDPLSGRAYVHQAMRLTGCGDPRTPVAETLSGKLPQRKLAQTAAAGYSSYGNQIGLATGLVSEVYHPGYIAKHLECGVVVAAAPAENVVRERPQPGDVVILLGGRTGRDGIGGATGSSKSHNRQSLTTMASEVQKGNAPEERKIQRLFRDGNVTRLIKRCNDFGAGGVSVAVGELADGLDIDLDAVRKKYDGLDGTELAISESQERMAVVVARSNADRFIAAAEAENLEAYPVAVVTASPRMVMRWRGRTIVDLSRDFLNTNGAVKHARAAVPAPIPASPVSQDAENSSLRSIASSLASASRRGLAERFDSTIGCGSVLMPFGGRNQRTPAQVMAALLPVLPGQETDQASVMAWGFDPEAMAVDPYRGAYNGVVTSLAKLVAAGADYRRAYLTLQEFFEKLREDPARWGKPFAALLGALDAQLDFGAAAIGGKDSMSGTFEQLDVPPTLISFAVAVGNMKRATSPEFKGAGHRVIRIAPRYQADGLTPDKDSLLEVFAAVEELTDFGDALAVSTPGYGATAEAIFKMTVGNQIGVKLANGITVDDLFVPSYGSFIIELADNAKVPAVSNLVEVSEVGKTTEAYQFVAAGETLDLAELQDAWEGGIESVFPYRSKGEEKGKTVETMSFDAPKKTVYTGTGVAKPHVIIPVFPGNNCEYDSAAAFERAGADVSTLIVNNLTPAAVAESTAALVEEIKKSQIIMIPGGFSGGDEPDGSAKFITAFFRAPAVTEAVRDLLNNRDGLMLGICNGFQALIKLGLVPYGDIVPMTAECPTLTFNTIGRHQSRLVRTRVASNLSPWLAKTEVGDMHTIAISHGEGRFVASDDVLAQLKANGQIATQYVDEAGVPGMDLDVNPNGSLLAIEGITSPDGRVFGKMGHSERYSNGTFVNVPGEKDQPLFAAGVEYFTA